MKTENGHWNQSTPAAYGKKENNFSRNLQSISVVNSRLFSFTLHTIMIIIMINQIPSLDFGSFDHWAHESSAHNLCKYYNQKENKPIMKRFQRSLTWIWWRLMENEMSFEGLITSQANIHTLFQWYYYVVFKTRLILVFAPAIKRSVPMLLPTNNLCFGAFTCKWHWIIEYWLSIKCRTFSINLSKIFRNKSCLFWGFNRLGLSRLSLNLG